VNNFHFRFDDFSKTQIFGHVENFNDIKVGDVLESFYLEEIKPAID